MRPADLTGLALVDRLGSLARPTIEDYVMGASEYVRLSRTLAPGPAKAAQIRLSAALGNALLLGLRAEIPTLKGAAGEREVSGALRIAKADVSEMHHLDGLRLAVELKPVNLAVGRAIWNRFGDIRTFAVNLSTGRKSTTHLIDRAVDRLVRAGGRRTEGDAPHLLEGVAVLAYDPDTATVHPDLPPPGNGLRWEEFVGLLAAAYKGRFVE